MVLHVNVNLVFCIQTKIHKFGNLEILTFTKSGLNHKIPPNSSSYGKAILKNSQLDGNGFYQATSFAKITQLQGGLYIGIFHLPLSNPSDLLKSSN